MTQNENDRNAGGSRTGQDENQNKGAQNPTNQGNQNPTNQGAKTPTDQKYPESLNQATTQNPTNQGASQNPTNQGAQNPTNQAGQQPTGQANQGSQNRMEEEDLGSYASGSGLKGSGNQPSDAAGRDTTNQSTGSNPATGSNTPGTGGKAGTLNKEDQYGTQNSANRSAVGSQDEQTRQRGNDTSHTNPASSSQAEQDAKKKDNPSGL